MVVSDSNCLVFGGYDGSTATNRLLQIDLQPVQQLQRSSLQDLIYSMACCGSACGNNNGLAAVADKGAVLGQAQDAVSDGDDGSNGAGTLKAVGVVPRAAVLPVPAVVKALSKKAAPAPLQLSDLPNAEEVAAMPQWKQVRQLHQVNRGRTPVLIYHGGIELGRGRGICVMLDVRRCSGLLLRAKRVAVLPQPVANE
jgi:hypothetical protein